MKKIFSKNTFVVSFFILTSSVMYAGPGDEGDDFDQPDQPAAPISTWVVVLPILGIALAYYAFKNNNVKA